jgi:hypothetical protein
LIIQATNGFTQSKKKKKKSYAAKKKSGPCAHSTDIPIRIIIKYSNGMVAESLSYPSHYQADGYAL